MDRGAWGLEVLILLAAWKTTHPDCVTLLRGNHESTTCTRLYGFHAEVQAKYSGHQGQSIYAAAKRVFAVLPLAARIAGVLAAVSAAPLSCQACSLSCSGCRQHAGGAWRPVPQASSSTGWWCERAQA